MPGPSQVQLMDEGLGQDFVELALEPAPPQRAGALLGLVDSLIRGDEDGITLGVMAARSGPQCFDLLIIGLALPLVAPLPPGIADVLSAAIGLPLMFVTVQFALGRRTLWLPRVIAERTIPRAAYQRALEHAAPLLRRLDRSLDRPRRRREGIARLGWETAWRLSALVLAIVLFLPIPFTDSFVALALVCLGAAHMRRNWADAEPIVGVFEPPDPVPPGEPPVPWHAI